LRHYLWIISLVAISLFETIKDVLNDSFSFKYRSFLSFPIIMKESD